MNAVVIESINKHTPKLAFRQIQVPQPLSDEVLVKMYAAPINPVDLMYHRGLYGFKPRVPAVPGFEGSGIVLKTGDEESAGKLLGKRVAVKANFPGFGTWGEFMVTKSSYCAPLDDGISYEKGASFFANPVTVLMMEGLIKQGNHLVVVQTASASSLGKMLIKRCSDTGVKTINIVRKEEQIGELKGIGGDHILNSRSAHFTEELESICTETKASIAFDAVGGDLTSKILKSLAVGGEMYVYGALSMRNIGGIDPSQFVFENKTLKSLWLSHWLPLQTADSLHLLYGKVNSLLSSSLSTNIIAEFPIESYEEAIKTYVKGMSQGKILLKHRFN